MTHCLGPAQLPRHHGRRNALNFQISLGARSWLLGTSFVFLKTVLHPRDLLILTYRLTEGSLKLPLERRCGICPSVIVDVHPDTFLWAEQLFSGQYKS